MKYELDNGAWYVCVEGQIDLFRGLKWGIVRLCSSKNARYD